VVDRLIAESCFLMSVEQSRGLNNPIEVNVNPDYVFPAEEIQDRAFRIEPIDYNGRTIKLVSIESKFVSQKAQIPDRAAMSVIAPDDWGLQVADAMEDTSLVFTAYFPPELEQTAYSSPFRGTKARSWGEQLLHSVYQTVADIAEEQGKRIAVADISNKLAFAVYEFATPNRVPCMRQVSAYGVQISRSEKYVPQAADARRMFTAKAIMQTAEAYPEGSSFMYIAAPAHVNRVKSYITQKPDVMDKLRYGVYATTMVGLDTSTRIYRHSDEEWAKVSDTRYCNPEKNLKYVLTAAGVLAAGLAVARNVRRSSGN
jgi:hypothetical protein